MPSSPPNVDDPGAVGAASRAIEIPRLNKEILMTIPSPVPGVPLAEVPVAELIQLCRRRGIDPAAALDRVFELPEPARTAFLDASDLAAFMRGCGQVDR